MKVKSSLYTVRKAARWFSEGDLKLKPPFQRNYVWKPRARSYLIDTILRGYPLPIILLRERPGVALDTPTEVVDGQQRLTTILAYIMPERFDSRYRFTISKTHNTQLAGCAYNDLPDQMKADILDYELYFHILPSSVDDQEVLRIFARLNSTGEKLNNQELRNAEYHGEFKTRMFELSLGQLDRWRSWKLFNEDDIARMKDVEYTSDLASRMLNGIRATTKATLDKLYRELDDEFPDKSVIEDRFEHVMDAIDQNLGKVLSNSEFRKVAWFWILFGNVHDIAFGTGRHALYPRLPSVKADPIPAAFWKQCVAFSSALTDPTKIPTETVSALSGRTTNEKTRRDRDKLFKRYVTSK